MTQQFGALTLPVESAGAEPIGDPALGVLGAYFSAVLIRFGGSAFESVSRSDIVQAIRFHNPEGPGGMHEDDLPCLYVWRVRDDQPQQISDGYDEARSQICVCWIRRPVTLDDHASIEPFGNAVAKILRSAVNAGRNPAYIADTDNTVAGRTYGTNVPEACGFSLFRALRIETTSARIIGTDRAELYPCVRALLDVTEISDTGTPTDAGFVPFRIDDQITTGGDDPLDTPQHIREPHTP